MWKPEKVGQWWHVVRYIRKTHSDWREMDGDRRYATENAALMRRLKLVGR